MLHATKNFVKSILKKNLTKNCSQQIGSRDMLTIQKNSHHSSLLLSWCQIKRWEKIRIQFAKKNHLVLIQQETASNMSDTKIWANFYFIYWENTLIPTWFPYNFSSTTITVVIHKMNTYEEAWKWIFHECAYKGSVELHNIWGMTANMENVSTIST